ncbi:DNA repair protein RecO [Halpernia frigidisoli]|uniref:DNA replication and repair protein RecO n=1 Tax=Halpernia frigidisoli TaxID=1125876 RepID=A0A1I3FCR0_9FLAO|nr:DNA repair protein RecO [Halpernia frigidisoli]SFI08671.1 DNA replication and repair protein RecO [Halpernia frigidisoli]
MTKKKGFLLSYLKYGDNDAILHCFTADEGFESFYIRGIYSSKNKKKFLLTPLSEIFLDVNLKRKSTALPLLNQIESVDTDYFEFDIKKSSVLFFISDLLNQVLKSENSQSKIYNEIELFIFHLKQDKKQIHLLFLFKIIQFLGFAPLINDGKYLDIETGVFTENLSHQVFDEEISSIWKNILENEDIYNFKIPQNKSRELLNSLLIYYQFHLENFRIPVSLEIVKEIFN